MADFTGLQYPLIKTAKGLFAPKKGVDVIKADLLQLLLTNPGERVMLPEYGTDLRSLLFEQNDLIVARKAKQIINDSVTRWEPRVIIENILVQIGLPDSMLLPEDTRENQDHILYIRIRFYDPENIQVLESLELQVPLGTTNTLSLAVNQDTA